MTSALSGLKREGLLCESLHQPLLVWLVQTGCGKCRPEQLALTKVGGYLLCLQGLGFRV